MGNTFSMSSPNGVIDINARGRVNGLMYFHRDFEIPSVPQPDILRLPESDSPDLFSEYDPITIDLVSSNSDSDSTHMTLSDEEIFPPTPPQNLNPQCHSPDLFAECLPPPLDTVSNHSHSTHCSFELSSGGGGSMGGRWATPAYSH